MSNQLQISGAAKIRSIQGPVVANSGVISALDGDASQYVRGDGTLADFPTSTGGGSSVSYYLNTSVSQGTIGGVAYKQLSKVPIAGAGTDVSISADGYIASYITDANDPSLLEVPAGNFNCEFYFSVNSDAHNPYVYAEVYKYDGTTFTLLGSSQSVLEYLTNGTTLSPYYFAIPVATSVLTITDRIAIRIYVNVDGRTVTLHTENNHLCQVVTTFSKGLTTLNSLTRQVQFFQTGTSGTDFAISSSVATHTFNIPDASASARGLITTGIQTIAGLKTITGTSLILAPISGDAGILNIKRGAFSGGINDYTSITSQADDLSIVSLTSSTNRSVKFDFSSITSGILKTYTLPNANGTLALLESTQTFSGVNTFNNGLSLRGGFYPVPTAGDTGLAGSGSGLSIISKVGSTVYTNNLDFGNSSNSYAFPNASGTIALTSSLSSYVPYTGATGSVDLGLFSLTSNTIKVIGDNSTYGGTLSIKQNNVTSLIGTGFTELFGKTNRLGISFGAGSIALISNSTLTLERTYTLPDVSGTLAILEAGSQTFTGTVFVLGSLGTKYGISIEKGNTPSPLTFNDIFIYASSGATNIVNFANSSYVSSFSFPTSNQTFTYPSASGTIALTSNLSSYVPYTGATSSVDLGINDLSSRYLIANGNGTASGILALKISNTVTATSGYGTIGALSGQQFAFVSYLAGNYDKIAYFNLSALSDSTPRVFTLPNATGTLALTSDIPSISGLVPYTGATTNVNLATRTLTANILTATGIGVNIDGDGSGGGALNLKNYNSISSAGVGYTSIFAQASDRVVFNLATASGTKYVAFTFNSLAWNSQRYYDLPNADGTLALTSDIPSGTITGTGSTNTHAKFTSASVIGNSMVSDDGTTLTSLGATRSNLYIKAANNTYYGQLAFTNGSNALYGGISYNNSGQYMQFETNTSEWMRLNSNGNLLINTTTDNGSKLQVLGSVNIIGTAGYNGWIIRQTGGSASAAFNLSYGAGGAQNVITAEYNTGNVGIGTSSPNIIGTAGTVLTILGASTTNGGTLELASNNLTSTTGEMGKLEFLGLNGSGSVNSRAIIVCNQDGTTTSSNMRFFTMSAGTVGERMRITSAGYLLINRSSASGVGKLQIATSGGDGIFVEQNSGGGYGLYIKAASNGGTYYFTNFSAGATDVGTITSNGTTTSYNTTSDYRLKENATPIANATSKIMQLKPVSYKWKNTEDEYGEGFLAHELQEIIPLAVTGEKDALNEDGSFKLQQVDYSKIVPKLVAAIQEQQALITSLQEQINEIKNK